MNSNNIQHIIAIGASAGGMEETHAFFDHTPLDEVSYVIIQHLSPDFKSRMAELLAKHSKLKICVAEHNMRVEKNQVYMIPNKKFMTIQGGKLRLTDKEGKDSPHMTIDTFFSSLAADSGHKAIGIILSGTGTDGSLGIEAIKNAGGLVLVQDPETAKFSGMPSHAISTGFADAVLSTESMPNLIKNYVKKLPWQPFNDALNESSEEEEKTMSAILDLIKDQLPHDFSNYKRSTLLRRTKRRMTYNNLKGLDQYFTFIKNNPSEMEELAKDFLISVTKFFRDKEAFELLEKDIIPDIFKNHTTENALKIWVAGCATGEEAYSLAILIKEYMVSTNQELEVKIFATDPENIALDVSKERLDRFFLREGNRYKVKEEIRRMLVIAYHDLVKNPPYCNTDLISCRNLLIYMNPLLQKKVFSMFHFGLKKGGYLFLGSSENAKINGDDFFEINKKWKIYIKKEAVRTARFNSFSLLVNEEVKPVKLPYTDSFDTSFKKIELVEKVNESIMNEFGVSGVCIDNNFNIVQNFGDLSKYLLPKMFEFNLNELLSRNLKVAVRTAVSKAQKLNGKAAIKQVHMKYNDSTYMLNLYVKPLIFSKPHLKLMLVLFREGEIESTDEIMEVFSPAQHSQAYLSDL
jgi:two-component system CheB/CheR fusion protein